MRIFRAAVAVTVFAGLVSCGAGGSSGSTESPAARRSPSASAAASPDSSPTTVTPIPTPSRSSPRLHELDWREYFGGFVPGGRAGPMKTTKTSASGWAHSKAGAVFAAAHYAVVADARQPAKVWRPVVSRAVPAGKRGAAVKALKKAGSGPPPGKFDEQPYAAWRPNIRVVGYTSVSVDGDRARVRVWARDDGDTWHARSVRLAWADGDWRLNITKKKLSPWKEKPPPDDMVSYSTV